MGFWRPFKQQLTSISDSLGKAQRVLETLWAILTEYKEMLENAHIKEETCLAHSCCISICRRMKMKNL
jgi:hypothetical protein